MHDTAKYLINADITADGVVERSDVVGAIFGQTEGLLGEGLDLRDLQDSSKVGRIDVEIDSENGQSFGEVTIATSLDQVETAILAAALETIDRVGPCRSTVEVRRIEDVRAAKRREVVERATQLLNEAFEGTVMSSEELVAEVRRSVRVEDITEYRGLPAGPRVADGDAIVVVEGRADVLTLLQYGVKNAIAVEGTDVPDAVADLTRERTVTAFLDGDRGGDLILKELSQVGEVDYVAFAPPDRSVEDLDRHEAMAALREKVPFDVVADAATPRDAVLADGATTEAGGSATDAGDGGGGEEGVATVGAEPERESALATAGGAVDTPAPETVPTPEGEESTAQAGETAGAPSDATAEASSASDGASSGDDETAGDPPSASPPETLRGHLREVIGGDTGGVRLLDADFGILEEGEAADAFDLLKDAETVPAAVVIDAELDQRVLDVAAQRGVDQVVARSTGEFVKRPTGVRVRSAADFEIAAE